MNASGMYHSVSIIGTGRVGRCLALAHRKAGFEVHSLFNRTLSMAELMAAQTGASLAKTFPAGREDLSPITFICVPDDAISDVAAQLAGIADDWSGYAFIHCSGARPAEELAVLSAKSAQIASFHPIQTFPSEPDAAVFRDIWISLQGNEELLVLLEEVARLFGAKTIRVTAEQKQQLHIAAVFACNYVVTLAGAAERLLPEGNQGLELLAPLMRQTLEQILSKGPAEALTGPLRRGDIQTLKNHVDALNDLPELQTLYTTLGRYTVTLINEMSSKPDNIDQVSSLFETT